MNCLNRERDLYRSRPHARSVLCHITREVATSTPFQPQKPTPTSPAAPPISACHSSASPGAAALASAARYRSLSTPSRQSRRAVDSTSVPRAEPACAPCSACLRSRGHSSPWLRRVREQNQYRWRVHGREWTAGVGARGSGGWLCQAPSIAGRGGCGILWRDRGRRFCLRLGRLCLGSTLDGTRRLCGQVSGQVHSY